MVDVIIFTSYGPNVVKGSPVLAESAKTHCSDSFRSKSIIAFDIAKDKCVVVCK